MTTTTFEQASKCPICGMPGEPDTGTPGPRGSKIFAFVCINEGCRWFGTGWVVQVNSDNTVPIRESGPRGQDKDYPAMSRDALARGRAIAEDAVRSELP